jgi:hypothetical protein
MKPPQGWKRPFDDPIPLARGRQFVTLKDTANYIQKLPKGVQYLDGFRVFVGQISRGFFSSDSTS